MEGQKSPTKDPAAATATPPTEKQFKARILTKSDLTSMISSTAGGGGSKMVPLRVPARPITVVTPNSPQGTSIPGVLVKPGANFPAGKIAYIPKSSLLPLTTKESSPSSGASTTTTTATTSSPSKVPNILQRTSSSSSSGSPAKNTIDRQVVSHETTIELKKTSSKPSILTRAPPPSLTAAGSENKESKPPLILTGKIMPLQSSNSNVNKDEEPAENVEQETENANKTEAADLLKPLDQDDSPASDASSQPEFKDLSLKCFENEFGALEVKKTKPANDENKNANANNSNSLDTSKDDSDSDSLDLACNEVQPPSPKKESPPKTTTNNNLTASRGGPKVREDDILCCGGCGCYGMAGEFFTTEACSSPCQSRIVQKNREKEKKERELAVQKQRREARKREKEAKEALEKQQEQELRRQQRQQQQQMEDDDDQEAEQQQHNAKPRLPYDSPHPWLDVDKGFSWSRYLECTNSRAAPSKLFHEAYPTAKNTFRVGMKLEAIDPEHPALICVGSVVQVQGYRVRVHLDGYSSVYDFWENANSANIFPVGWCEAHKQKLLPPPGFEMFTWKSYLESTGAQGAPKSCFHHKPKTSDLNGWKIGLKLEAVDKSNTSLICVATVTNVMDGRVLVHFDGWDLDYDYWVTPNSPYIHPRGWCSDNGIVLNKPKGYRGEFSWERYLEETRSKAVPNWAFKPPKSDVSLFRKGMKLEVVDKRNPIFVRVSTVVDVLNHQIKVHFDGWPDEYDFWVEDDSTDFLHPMMWCAKTDHNLMPPLTIEEVSYHMSRGLCPTPGCNSLGHLRDPNVGNHANLQDCPYAPQNMSVDQIHPDRLRSMRPGQQSIPNPPRQLVQPQHVGPPGLPPPPAMIDHSQRRESEDDPELGRGNRKRKRRKFFDDNDDNNHAGIKMTPPKLMMMANGGSTASSSSSTGSGWTSNVFQDRLRGKVFNPGYGYNCENMPPTGLPDGWDPNSVLLQPRIQSLTLTEVTKWTSRQVSSFLTSLPCISTDLSRLETKIVEEEVDGEAMMLMTQDDLVNLLGLKLGPAIKVFNALMLIKSNKKSTNNQNQAE